MMVRRKTITKKSYSIDTYDQGQDLPAFLCVFCQFKGCLEDFATFGTVQLTRRRGRKFDWTVQTIDCLRSDVNVINIRVYILQLFKP